MHYAVSPPALNVLRSKLENTSGPEKAGGTKSAGGTLVIDVMDYPRAEKAPNRTGSGIADGFRGWRSGEQQTSASHVATYHRSAPSAQSLIRRLRATS